MFKGISKLVMFCLILLTSGCVTVGTNFPTDNIHKIRIGVSKSSVIELLGQPHEKSTYLHEGREFEVFEYSYGTASTVAFTRPNIRILNVELLNESVNGYNFISSFSDNKKDFDIESRNKLKLGESTKEDVRNALGEPSGIALIPTKIASDCKVDKTPETAWEMWKYEHISSKWTKGHRVIELNYKIVEVYFDEKGRLVKICHSEGSKEF